MKGRQSELQILKQTFSTKLNLKKTNIHLLILEQNMRCTYSFLHNWADLVSEWEAECLQCANGFTVVTPIENITYYTITQYLKLLRNISHLHSQLRDAFDVLVRHSEIWKIRMFVY